MARYSVYLRFERQVRGGASLTKKIGYISNNFEVKNRISIWSRARMRTWEEETGYLPTACPKIYRKSVLHLHKYTANLYYAVQICGKF